MSQKQLHEGWTPERSLKWVDPFCSPAELRIAPFKKKEGRFQSWALNALSEFQFTVAPELIHLTKFL